jgi:hypothetical protein
MELSSSLQTQHAAAQRTIELLEEKVLGLEVLVVAQAPAPAKLTPVAPAELIEPETAVPLLAEPAEPAAAPPPAQIPQLGSLTELTPYKVSEHRQSCAFHN